jgi:uncharacterized protein YoxC
MFSANTMSFPETSALSLLPAPVQTAEAATVIESVPRVLDDGFVAEAVAEPFAETLYVDVPGLEELARAIQQATDARDSDHALALPSWEELEAELTGAEERIVREAFEALREADQRLRGALFAAQANLQQAQAQAEQELTEAKEEVRGLGEQVRQITERADTILAKATALLSGTALEAFQAQVEARRQADLAKPLQELEAASDRLARAEKIADQYAKGASPEHAYVEELLLADGAEGAQLRSAVTRLAEVREKNQPAFERAAPRLHEEIGLTEIQERWRPLFEQVELERQAEANLRAAEQAARSGQGREAQRLLELAKRGRADVEQVKRIQDLIAQARRQETTKEFRARLAQCARLCGAAAKIEAIEKEAQALERQEPTIYAGLASAIARQISQARAEAAKMAKVRFAVIAQNVEAYYRTEGVTYAALIDAENGRVTVWKKEGSRWALHVERWLEEKPDPTSGYVHYKMEERWPSKRVLAQDPGRLETERAKWLERHAHAA